MQIRPPTSRLRSVFSFVVAVAASGCLDRESTSSELSPDNSELASAASPERAASSASSASSASTASVPTFLQTLEAHGLDPFRDLETLAVGNTPRWPAPSPRIDGAPVTMRAVRSGRDVVLWAHGAPKGAAGISYEARIADERGIVRESSKGTHPLQGDEEGWYRVVRIEDAGKYARAQVQLTALVASQDGASGARDAGLWKPSLEHHLDWRYSLPEAPAKLDGSSQVGLSLVAVERLEKTTALVVVIHNRGSAPITRLELDVVPRDADGTMGSLGAAWVPMGGDVSIPNIAPGKRSVVRVLVNEDVERVLAATDFELKVGKVEHGS